MSTNELSAKLRKLKKLQAKAEELEAEITAIQNEIKEEMEARGTEEWRPVHAVQPPGHMPQVSGGIKKAPCITRRGKLDAKS